MRNEILIVVLLLNFNFLFSQNTILWEVKDESTNKISYLLGTNHQIGGHFLDTFIIIKNKLFQSEIAVFESIAKSRDNTSISKRENNFGYKKTLKRKYLKKLKILSQDWKYPLSKLHPSEVVFKLSKNYYYTNCDCYLPEDSLIQLDTKLQNMAEEKDIPLKGLETDSIQMTYINRTNKNINWQELKNEKKLLGNLYFWINAHTDPKMKNDSMLCKYQNSYQKFQLDYFFSDECPENMSLLLKERNNNWMKLLTKFLTENNCFIAVGFEHLKYNSGLIIKLQDEGFKVTPLIMKK